MAQGHVRSEFQAGHREVRPKVEMTHLSHFQIANQPKNRTNTSISLMIGEMGGTCIFYVIQPKSANPWKPPDTSGSRARFDLGAKTFGGSNEVSAPMAMSQNPSMLCTQ